jgi:DNA-binding IclR family transcriptional regulator
MFIMENSMSEASNAGMTRPAVPAVAKAVRILEVVSTFPEAMGISDIARSLGLSKSTVHGIVSTLVAEGFLTSVSGGKLYGLGPRLLELGTRARDQRLLDAAEAELQYLVERSGQTALFGRRQGNGVVILARRESLRSLNLSAPVGLHVPLMAGSLGKAYLASTPPSLAKGFLERNVLPRFTERSITDVSVYLRQVHQAREAAYALERGEYLPGICAVASAFPWLDGTYFVWTVGIDANYDDAELRQIGTMVSDAAAEILDGLEQHVAPTGSKS